MHACMYELYVCMYAGIGPLKDSVVLLYLAMMS